MTTELERHARAIRTARAKLALAHAEGARAARGAAAAGVSDVQIARALGVNRTTVRRWLGKPR
jgi:DNA invertase Pin-like site-specific DNA recombinase